MRPAAATIARLDSPEMTDRGCGWSRAENATDTTFSGVSKLIGWEKSPPATAKNSVLVGPGLSARTRRPLLRVSSAIASVSERT